MRTGSGSPSSPATSSSVAFAGARLREALEREGHDLAAIVDGATDVIVQVDETCRVTRLNPAGERLLGWRMPRPSGGPAAMRSAARPPAAIGVADCPLAETIRRAARSATARPRSAASRARSRSPAATRRACPDPAVSRATAILRDLSAAEALEQLREGFVATVSHELRTPIALIRGYAETLLQFELEPEQQREYLERIQGLTTRLGDLVSQILDATHLDADPLILERTPVAFAALVARLRGDLALTGRRSATRHDVARRPPADRGRSEPRRADPREPRRQRAQVRARRVAGRRRRRRPMVRGSLVHIDDEGIGIPETERPLVAEPFHRAWNVRESRIPGTGLGLYICRRLVEAHGGNLTIGDRPDGQAGTRVTFTLPLLAGRRDRRSSTTPAGSATREHDRWLSAS